MLLCITISIVTQLRNVRIISDNKAKCNVGILQISVESIFVPPHSKKAKITHSSKLTLCSLVSCHNLTIIYQQKKSHKNDLY